MTYNFDIEVAKEYGVDAAILINNLQYWLLKNKANNKNFFDNHYWTYNSIPAFCKLFPFWSIQNIKTILNNLKEKGVIIVGNYNKSKYDRTNWYAFADEEKWLKTVKTEENIQENFEENAEFLDKLELTHQKMSSNPPIPDINTNNKQDSNSVYMQKQEIRGSFIPPTEQEVLEYARQMHESRDINGFYCSKDTAVSFYLQYAAQGWMLGNGNHITNWKARLKKWALEERKKDI